MIRRLLLLLFLAAACVTRAAFADDAEETALDEARARWERMTPEQRKSILEAWERWKLLPSEERRRRQAVFEEHLKGSTREEREELLRKLRQVKARRDIDDLCRRQDRLRRVAREFEKELPPDLRAKLAAMPVERREAILALGVIRLSETMRECFLESLSPEERRSIAEVEEARRSRALMELRARKATERIPEGERAAMAALPEAERRERMAALLRRIHEDDLRAARDRVGAELVAIADLPTEEIEARLRAPDVPRTLRELGLREDPVLIRRLSHLPRGRIRQAIQRLRTIAAITDAAAREMALRDFASSLPDR